MTPTSERESRPGPGGRGPLAGVKVVELAGIGPGPYACMLLAEAGADVVRVDRPAAAAAEPTVLARSRPSVGIDLKHPSGVELVLDLVAGADVLVEGFRPGVAERLGVGPGPCLARNPRLVYARMTGWGQDGPMALDAGHDIDYIALSGALWAIGRAGERPVPPLNLVGDFGGGGMMLAFGVCAALVEVAGSGQGQVVDAAMVDGAASLATMLFGRRRHGGWIDQRGANLLDTGAHFYEVYETSDGGYVAVGAIEPQFYAALLAGLGLDPADLPPQMDRSRWPEMKERFAAIFATATRDEWAAAFEGKEACVVPVLSPAEVHDHPHHRARGTFVDVGGVPQPGAVPRFARTPGAVVGPPGRPCADTERALGAWGVDPARIDDLRRRGVLA